MPKRQKQKESENKSKFVIYAALVGNLIIAASKFVAATLTGSSAMMSEGVHSLVDTSNEFMLIYGLRRAALPPDLTHPFGYGRELYFWSFIVSLQFFVFGAGVSFYQGVSRILDPQPIQNVTVTYIVLALSVLCEGTSWIISLREFGRRKGRLSYFAAFRRSKDPTTFTVLFEDSAALLGLLIAFIGILGASQFEYEQMDGAASIGIGLILSVTAIFLARETKSLLIGERTSPKMEAAIMKVVDSDPIIHSANGVVTVQIGPEQVIAAISVEFEKGADGEKIQDYVRRVEDKLKVEFRHITTVWVKPQSAREWAERLSVREQATKEQEGG